MAAETTTAAASLLQFASPLVAKNHFVKASFGGFQGSGKTRTAAEFVVGVYKQLKLTKPLLVIDNEKGARFLKHLFSKALPKTQVLVKDTTSLGDIITSMDYLDKGEIDFLFMDSLSKVWYRYVNDYKKKNNVQFMTMQDWGKVLPVWQTDFSDRFVNIDGSIVFTGRGGFTYEKEEDELNAEGGVKKKGQFVKSGIKMKIAGETPYETDLNIWMELRQTIVGTKVTKQWREAQVMKDRTATIDGKTFKNPTFKEFKPVIDFIMSLPTGQVNGETNGENRAPGESYEAQNKKNKKTIALEEIKGVFAVLALGKSNDDKQITYYILETLFKTTSWKAIEVTDIDTLTNGLIILKEFRVKYEEKKPETLEDVKKVLEAVQKEKFVFDK